MRYLKEIKKTLALLALFHIALPQIVYAYLDPGTGSYLIQVVIAALLGGLYAVKLFWKNIKTFIKNIFSIGGENEKIEKK